MPCHGMQSASVREKEMKRQTLLELVDYVNTGTGKFTELVSEVCAGAIQKLNPRTMHCAESICALGMAKCTRPATDTGVC